MPGTDRDAMTCANIQATLRQERALTAAESAHVETCEACLEAWLDASVKQALDAKPEAPIPADFAARVAAQLPEKSRTPAGRGGSMRHWGLIMATVFVAGGMIGTAIADPTGLTTRMGMIFLLIAASEIAGIALWLGIGRSGERRS